MSDLPEQEAVKVVVSVGIQAGSIRQRVKRRELNPKDVLEWLKSQPYASPDLVTWLRNQASHWSAAPAKKEEVVAEKVEKPRKRARNDRKGRKDEQRSTDSGRTN